MKTIEQLKDQHNELLTKLRNEWTQEGADELLNAIRSNEAEQKRLKIAAKLEAVNREQSRLRDEARIIFRVEDVPAEVACNDGTRHMTRVKKYPVLNSLEYARLTFNKDGKLEAVKTGLKTWQLIAYNQTERPATFEKFLELNSVQPADITPEEISAVIEENERINAEFKKACEKFSADKDALKIHTYNYLGLFTQHSTGHNYEYLLNY